MNNLDEGFISGATIADSVMKDVPDCLRVRMGYDAMYSVLTVDEQVAIENLIGKYLDEAVLIERDFDYDEVMG